MVEPARRFRQRERTLQRRTLRANPRTWGAYLFYSLLNLISGQGEEPQRIFVAYAVIISTFTAAYWAVSQQFASKTQPALHWYEALVLSLSSFHGRGFFPADRPGRSPGDPRSVRGGHRSVRRVDSHCHLQQSLPQQVGDEEKSDLTTMLTTTPVDARNNDERNPASFGDL